jgi:hypothetical protein
LIASVLSVTAAAAEPQVIRSPLRTVTPVEGKPFEARFLDADAKGRWTFGNDVRRRTFPVTALVRWGRPVEPTRGPIAMLADGGLIPGEPVGMADGRIQFESDAMGSIELPLELLAGVILQWPSKDVERDQLVDRLLRHRGTTDLVLLANGDRLTGIVSRIDGQAVGIERDGTSSDLARPRVSAVLFNAALRAAPPSRRESVWVGLSDGSRLLVKRLRTTHDRIELTPLDASITWRAPLRDCVFLQPLHERVVYLSDRKDDGYRHVPFCDLTWPYRRDRNVFGGMLRAGGVLHPKGLGVHSSARITYLLNEPFDRFEAALALDDRAGKGGSVRYHVFVDQRRQFSSKPIRGGAEPTQIRVDLTGAKRLDLVVDFGERADQLDYADWLDARLIRAEKQHPPARSKETPGSLEEPPGAGHPR